MIKHKYETIRYLLLKINWFSNQNYVCEKHIENSKYFLKNSVRIDYNLNNSQFLNKILTALLTNTC